MRFREPSRKNERGHIRGIVACKVILDAEVNREVTSVVGFLLRESDLVNDTQFQLPVLAKRHLHLFDPPKP